MSMHNFDPITGRCVGCNIQQSVVEASHVEQLRPCPATRPAAYPQPVNRALQCVSCKKVDCVCDAATKENIRVATALVNSKYTDPIDRQRIAERFGIPMPQFEDEEAYDEPILVMAHPAGAGPDDDDDDDGDVMADDPDATVLVGDPPGGSD